MAGHLHLHYDSSWLARREAVPLSLSLPLSQSHHSSDAVRNYLQGLLPDNWDVRRRWAREYHVSPDNPFALLRHVGRDVAGAAEFISPNASDDERPTGFAPLTDTDIAARLRTLQRDSAAWVTGGRTGQFSLAGAQAKFTLTWFNDQWHDPGGDAPSTHIFKPGIDGLAHSALGEHLLLQVAAAVGLPVVESRYQYFEDLTAIVVTRFDRATAGTSIQRIHQEDLCQATGTPPDQKYENEGGPGLADIAKLIRDTMPMAPARKAAQDLQRFAIFNWLTASTDAHAKNIAVLHTGNGPRLAPLYDLASALPYLDHAERRRATLAMRVGRHYRIVDIQRRHWHALAETLGVTTASTDEALHDLTSRLPSAIDRVSKEHMHEGEFVQRWQELLQKHVRTLAVAAT